MPCQSPAELEHRKWLTLPEAVAYICAADRCERDDARQKLGKALAKGALGSLRWADAQPTPRVGGATIPLDNPPACIPESADIDWEAGTVRDEWGETAPAPRVLLILSLRLRTYLPALYPRANRDDEDRYEAQQTRWMREAREKREAEEAARQAVWNAEFEKPMPQRQYFRFGEVANALALDPKNYTVDSALRANIIEELTVRVRRQQFDLAGGEVATLSGDPPAFEPLPPISPDGIPVGVESWLLRRDACRRFLKKSLLPRAPRVLSEWFPERSATPPSRLKPFWPKAEQEIMEWLRENGCPTQGDGNQAKLERFTAEWLNKHGWGEDASPPTIRRHVRACMKRRRAQLGC